VSFVIASGPIVTGTAFIFVREPTGQPGSIGCDTRAGDRRDCRSGPSRTGVPAVFAVFAGNYQPPLTFSPQKSWPFGAIAKERIAGSSRLGADRKADLRSITETPASQREPVACDISI
jgi:hypothetical protein